jgi:D-glycero-alpha-D-manno-heptose-7-phosphate kinase
MKYKSRAPLRLGLAGGGTDIAAYSDVYGGQVINSTIDRYAYCTVENSGSATRFESIDQFLTDEFDPTNNFEDQYRLKLHRGTYLRMMNDFNNGKYIPLSISTYTDAPVGSGLGTSSTITVAMVSALSSFLGVSMSPNEVAELAYEIERKDCGLAGGKQDQFSAAFGGFNFMEFLTDGTVKVDPIRISTNFRNELESSLLLYFSGVSRSSSQIITDQTASITRDTRTSLAAMHEIKAQALSMRDAILSENIQDLGECIRAGWEQKKRTSKSVSSSHFDKIIDNAFVAGASAAKISGAGGGGFILILTPIESRGQVIRSLNTYGGAISNCHFTNLGVENWNQKH